jgi:hypothetical protein
VLTTNASVANLYVNGVFQQTVTDAVRVVSYMFGGTAPLVTTFGNTSTTIGSVYFDGYMSDIFGVAGQALLPTTFGQFDANGVWVPYPFATAKANVITAGGFGTNGFALNFDSANFNSGTLVWADQSGNGNDFTANWNCQTGANAAAGSDLVNDAPINNILNWGLFQYPDASTGASTYNYARQLVNGGSTTLAKQSKTWTKLPSSGKFYFWSWWNWYVTGGPATAQYGVLLSPTFYQNVSTLAPPADSGYFTMGEFANATAGASGTFTTGTQTVPIGTQQKPYFMFIDMDNGKAWVEVDGNIGNGNPTSGTNPILTWTPGRELYLCPLQWPTPSNTFAQTYDYTAGSGLNTIATPTTDYGYSPIQASNWPAATIPDGSTGFQAVLDTGANILTAAQAAFPNGLWWIKNRANADNNQLIDSVRGGTNALQSNTNLPPQAYSTPTAGDNCVAWSWATNASGLNTATGFQIVTYTGTGANLTVPHSLGAAPQLMLVKCITQTTNWAVYHSGLGPTQYRSLNNNNPAVTSATVWNNTAPTSTDFTIGTLSDVNTAGQSYIAYIWTPIAGYSSIGTYTGNNSSDGSFIYTGFAPQFVITNNYANTGSWKSYTWDFQSYNQLQYYMTANTTDGQLTNSPSNVVDFLSNGFKWRGGGTETNGSGNAYIYWAFAENPFGGSNVAPVTAR